MWFVFAVAAVFFFHRVPFVGPLAQEVNVSPGQDALLQCQGPRDAEITLLEWRKPELKSDGYVFFYRNRKPYEKYQHEFFKGRVELKDPAIKDGDVSVILRNVSIRDTGTYECRITTMNTRRNKGVPSEFKHCINLTVRASGLIDEVTKNGGEKVKEEKVRGENEKRESNGYLSVIPTVAAAAFFLLGIAAVKIYKKLKKKREHPKTPVTQDNSSEAHLFLPE